jgi:hypothetical protein
MSRYARMFLHFLHAITNDRDRVHTLVFGTRLTNITRHLRHRDVDIALSGVAQSVADWSGGTRIGASLKDSICAGHAPARPECRGPAHQRRLDRDLGRDLSRRWNGASPAASSSG